MQNNDDNEPIIKIKKSQWTQITKKIQSLTLQNKKLQQIVNELKKQGKQCQQLLNKDINYQDQNNNKIQLNVIKHVNDELWKISSTSYGQRTQVQKGFEQSNTKLKSFLYSESNNYQNMKKMKQQWQLWSKKLQNTILMKKRNSLNLQKLETQGNINNNLGKSQICRQHRYSIHNFVFQEKLDQIDVISIPEKCQLIQEICLFGPQEQEIINMQKSKQRKCKTKYQMYYPINNVVYQVYGNYIYPQQAVVRNIKCRNETMQINRMIFKKNSKRQECSMFIFQSQQDHPIHTENNPLIDKVNPSKWLHALSIQFDDFLVLDGEQSKGIQQQNQMRIFKNNKGNLQRNNSGNITSELSLYLNNDNTMKTQNQSPRKTSEISNIFKSQYCLCILSYFPFVSFLSELLLRIMDQIKIKRMNRFNSKNFNKVDIRYFIQQLSQIAKKILYFIRQTPLHKKLQFTLTITENNTISLQLNSENNLQLISLLCNQWAFRIFKLFDKDTFYQIYCYVMLETSVFFVCSNRHFLTFVLMLFVSILGRPFGYPHPCVSIVFDDQLLQTPFTAILGINRDSIWLDNNMDLLLSNKQNVIIINLNEQSLKIKMKKKIKCVKSEKLKKIVCNFYKKLENFHSSTLFHKNNLKDILYKQITKEQNELVNGLIMELQKYYDEQILCFLPNEAIIEYIKGEIMKSVTNMSEINYQLLKYIDKYLFQSRKNKERDQFIELFLQKQILSVYLAHRYDIT